MASFLSNMFPTQAVKDGKSFPSELPATPTKNNFITPISTPLGSPSKRTLPPGANELPSAFDSSLKLNPVSLDSPVVKLGRPQSGAPLSPTKSNLQPADDGYFTTASPNVDNSVIHKSGDSPGTPLKKQGQENTPPSRIPVRDSVYQHNQAALSRQELYQLRDTKTATSTTKRFNTTRGLTPEEMEILKKPNVRRLVNVTQLCKTVSRSPASLPAHLPTYLST